MMELTIRSKTGLMKRLDRYRRSKKGGLMTHLTPVTEFEEVKNLYASSRSDNTSERVSKASDNSRNDLFDGDSHSSNVSNSSHGETKRKRPESDKTTDIKNEILEQIIKNGIAQLVDKNNIDYYITNLPKIEGISYDRKLNCFKSTVPLKFSKTVIENSFSVRNYGLKNAWLKAIGSLYTNIAFIIFDYPQIISRLRSNAHLNTPNSKGNLGSAFSDNDPEMTSNINGNAELDAGNASFSVSVSGNSTASVAELASSSVEDVFEILNNSNNNVSASGTEIKGNHTRDDYLEESQVYEALLSSSRGRKIQTSEEEDPRKIAESLKPWHQNIFWIPSICRWRTLYYDANSVKHSKTFTPAFFGGVKEAYYAALEFRNMIDNMDKLTQSKIRRKWVQSSLPLGVTSMGNNGSGDSSGSKCSNCGGSCGCGSGSSVSNDRKSSYNCVESGLDIVGDAHSHGDNGSTTTSSSSSNGHINGKEDLNCDKKLDIHGISEFNNLIGCGRLVVDNLAKFIARKRFARTEEGERSQDQDPKVKLTNGVSSVNEYASVNDRKMIRGNRTGRRGRPLKRPRPGSRNKSINESRLGDTSKSENETLNGEKLDYDVDFLSGLDKKGLYIPIPFDWEES